MAKNYSQSEQKELFSSAQDIAQHASKKINDGELIVYNGLILPKEYKIGTKNEVEIQPLQYEMPDTGQMVLFEALVFRSYTQPNGPLLDNMACQGLMYYAIKTFRLWHERTQQLSYEDDTDAAINYANIYKTTAMQYCTKPEKMKKYWPHVKKAFKLMFDWNVPPSVERATQEILHDYAQ